MGYARITHLWYIRWFHPKELNKGHQTDKNQFLNEFQQKYVKNNIENVWTVFPEISMKKYECHLVATDCITLGRTHSLEHAIDIRIQFWSEFIFS